MAAARYLAGQPVTDTVVHLHEPVFHHLLPAALSASGFRVVSTVQTNLPVNTSVYGPAVRSLLRQLGADPAVAEGLSDPPLDSHLHRAMRVFLPQTRLYRDNPGPDYVSVLGLVTRSADAVDFLSEGQREHALTQAETPFAQLFRTLSVHRELAARANQLTVGGCAIGAHADTAPTTVGHELLDAVTDRGSAAVLPPRGPSNLNAIEYEHGA